MLQVLSHHLSRRVTEMYEIAQQGTAQTGKLKIKVLQFFEDQEELWDKTLRCKVEKSAEEYLNRYRLVSLCCCLCGCRYHQHLWKD